MADPTAHQVHQVPSRLLDASKCPKPYVDSFENYKKIYEESIKDPQAFWGKVSDNISSSILSYISLYHVLYWILIELNY
jgi:acetyl-CoA synthetase